MQDLEWLNDVFGTVRCVGCGATYARGALAVVGTRNEYWFVRCSCDSCGAEGLGVVIVKETAAVAATSLAPAFRATALRVDDVLEAHDILRDYAGDMHRLFST